MGPEMRKPPRPGAAEEGKEDRMETIDAYCERLGPGFWAEPLNAVTNAAFLIGALSAWAIARRAGRDGDWAVIALVAIEAAIGVGSFLFHTFATRWAGAADVFPIMVFILVYVHLATVRFFALPAWSGLIAAAAFLPAAAGLGWTVRMIAGPLNGSAGYVAVMLAILAYGGALLWTGRGAAGRALVIGAGMLGVSIFFRTIDDQDGAVCAMAPIGTHFMWHVINGAMLAWMIVAMIRHGRPARG